MKKILLIACCAMLAVFTAFAADNEIVVTVSEPGQKATSQLAKQIEEKGKKAALRKYLLTQNDKIPEKVLDEALAEAEKFVSDIELEGDKTFEDGEMTGKFTVTIKPEEVAQWLELKGLNANTAANGTKTEIVIMEEPPDAGAIKMSDAFGTGLEGKSFFFQRYTMFQRRIRDALVKKVGTLGFNVILLEDNEAYASFKKSDPVLVGVAFDPSVGASGDFKITENFVKTVQANNPDTLVLYYRIDALAFDPTTKEIRTTVALSIKDLASNKTSAIGSRDFAFKTDNTQADMLMADFGTCVERAMNALLNGEDMAQKLNHLVVSMRNAAARPSGPMKVVINVSNIDSKIRTRAKVQLKKEMIAAGLTTQDNVKVQGNSLTFAVTKKDIPDADELWVAIQDVLGKVGIEATDDQKAVNGGTMTVTPGK